jgi:hypothetical protein
LNPLLLVTQSESAALTFMAERMRISCTSRQPRLGLASSINATTPATSGVADDVPLNVSV